MQDAILASFLSFLSLTSDAESDSERRQADSILHSPLPFHFSRTKVSREKFTAPKVSVPFLI